MRNYPFGLLRAVFTRFWSLTAIACLVAMTAGDARAAIVNDAGTGTWNTPGSWADGVVPTSSADVITIDEYVISATSGAAGTFTGGEIHISGAGELKFISGYQSTAPAALNLYMNGGTFRTGNGNTFAGGPAGSLQAIDISGISTIIGSSGGDSTTIGSAANSAALTGAGTLVKMGAGGIAFESGSAGTGSDFRGTLDIREGSLTVTNQGMLKEASVILSPGSRLHIKANGTGFASTGAASTPVVKSLYGSGLLSWSHGGYARDLAIAAGGVLSPGTATTAGTITRSSATNSNDLIFKTDAVLGRSTLEMDIFGVDSADKISWLDAVGTATSMVDFRNANLTVRMFTPSEDLATTQWVLIESDVFGAASASSSSSSGISQITFGGPISFLNADGSPIDEGWQDLQVTYDYTAGNSQVILTGRYAAVPEPMTLGLLVIGGLGVLIRSRRQRA